jgi:large subunit ribosomal protein L18e
MGKDLIAGGRNTKHGHRTEPKTENVYLRLLAKLYEFLARRVPDSKFNKVILRRLIMSRTNRPPMGLARLLRYVRGQEEKKTVVFVGTVTDDVRLTGNDIKPIKLVALHVTDGARARILNAGGQVLTFDQFARENPTGSNTVLLRGLRSARTSNRYFGVPVRGDVRPRVRSEGRKFEQARGRRKSRGFAV